MSDFEIGKMLIDKGVQNGIEAYKQGIADANKELEPLIKEIHDCVYNEGYLKGIEEGIEMSAFAFGYIYDGDCERCPAESECEYGKPCIDTLKEYIKTINSDKESIEARRRIWGTK